MVAIVKGKDYKCLQNIQADFQLIEMKIVRPEDAPSLETVKGRRGLILQAGEKAMLMMLIAEPGISTPQPSSRTDGLSPRG